MRSSSVIAHSTSGIGFPFGSQSGHRFLDAGASPASIASGNWKTS